MSWGQRKGQVQTDLACQEAMQLVVLRVGVLGRPWALGIGWEKAQELERAG